MFRLGKEGGSCQNCLLSGSVFGRRGDSKEHTSDYGWKPHLVLPL